MPSKAPACRRRSRTQRASASLAGRQGQRLLARSTATDMGKRRPAIDPQRVQPPSNWRARGHVRNTYERVSEWGAPHVECRQNRSAGETGMLTYRMKAPVKKQPCRNPQAQARSTKERPTWATAAHTWCQGERGPPPPPGGAWTSVQSVRRARGGPGRPPSSSSLEATRSPTDWGGVSVGAEGTGRWVWRHRLPRAAFECRSGPGAGGGPAAHLPELTLHRRPKSCERRGSRVPVILPNGRPDGQAGCVARLCLR